MVHSNVSIYIRCRGVGFVYVFYCYVLVPIETKFIETKTNFRNKDDNFSMQDRTGARTCKIIIYYLLLFIYLLN